MTRLATLTALVAFGAFGWTGIASASHFSVSTTLWGYQAASSNAKIFQYDIGPADAFVTSCTPPGSINGRGLAFDPSDGNLWYTFVDQNFAGDGLIHKTTPPPACAPVTTIPFGDGPGGTVQDGIGALDVDPDDGTLWAAGYQPIGSDSFLYKVSPTGTIIDSCHVPFGDGGEGNDTLAEAKLKGLPGSGSYLLTDAGELTTAPDALLVVDEATCVGGGAATIVATFPKSVGMSGIDYETKLITTDGSSIYNLGDPPFGSPLAVMSALPGDSLEDITLRVGPGPPTTLTLTPKTASNTVGSQHCVTAHVEDGSGNPTPGITVRFSVSGSVATSGSAVTDANGDATFCYVGPALPGSDVISAYADTNSDDVQQPEEPGDTATKEWVLPRSTPGCKVTDGGRITAANGDAATFGSVAKVSAGATPSGAQQYQDHGAAVKLDVHSTAVLAVTCSGNEASVFGKARINGAGSFDYRIDLTDNGEPGAGADQYRIRLSTGYDSGEQTLSGGNIQLH